MRNFPGGRFSVKAQVIKNCMVVLLIPAHTDLISVKEKSSSFSCEAMYFTNFKFSLVLSKYASIVFRLNGVQRYKQI